MSNKSIINIPFKEIHAIKIKHIFGHKLSLNKFEQTGMFYKMFSDNNRIVLEINENKISRKSQKYL